MPAVQQRQVFGEIVGKDCGEKGEVQKGAGYLKSEFKYGDEAKTCYRKRHMQTALDIYGKTPAQKF